jgi:hypothetical protein
MFIPSYFLLSSHSPATPRTVFASCDAVLGVSPGIARIISTPFVTRNSNAVPCGNKLFASLYPAMLSQHPLRLSPSSSSEDATLHHSNVLFTSSSVMSVNVDFLGSTAAFLNMLSGKGVYVKVVLKCKSTDDSKFKGVFRVGGRMLSYVVALICLLQFVFYHQL